MAFLQFQMLQCWGVYVDGCEVVIHIILAAAEGKKTAVAVVTKGHRERRKDKDVCPYVSEPWTETCGE